MHFKADVQTFHVIWIMNVFMILVIYGKKNPLKIRKNPANSGKTWQRKVRKNYVKSIIHLPRQLERKVVGMLNLLGEREILRQEITTI